MNPAAALLVIDVQNDFCPQGALAVAEADAIVPLVNRLARRFETVVLTQDWHPADHVSFAGRHPGLAPFTRIMLPYGPQTLWPTHCVMATPGAAFHPGLDIPHAGLILRKGMHREVDSYSAFLEADRATVTGLAGYLAARGIAEVFLCGLALDFCVAWSAEDAVSYGFKTTVVTDACRAIDTSGSLRAALTRLDKAGVRRVVSTDLDEG